MIVPRAPYAQLVRLSNDIGLFEHAKFTVPRPEHGYCVDDVARGLVVAVREPEAPDELVDLARTYLRFVVAAQAPDGRFHNRRALDGTWEDEPNLEDCWGRALWGLGTAVAHAPVLAPVALAHFERGAGRRSPHTRAMAFAALGAAEVLQLHPEHAAARQLLGNAAVLIGTVPVDRPWQWPEERLRYANAALPETLIAAGLLLEDHRTLDAGLRMLAWLLDIETRDGHLSVTPHGGWSAGEARPGFDQQPIEVAALADACARAFEVTGDSRWRDGVVLAAEWFLGNNDSLLPLYDPISGGGCDGLEASGRNENQGAESTLALISTFQQAHHLLALHR